VASQLSRIFFIDGKIRRTGEITLREIMYEGNVSAITAKRDIEFLRYTLDAPIVYDKKLKAYVYETEFQLLNFAGEQLFLFYVMSRGALSNMNYLPLTNEYARKIIAEKIKEILPNDYKKLADKFAYFYSDYERIDFATLGKIIEAIKESKVCKMNYLTKGKTASERKIEPLKAICYGAKWYLLAYCRKRKDLRIFSFSRITEIEPLDEHFNAESYGENADEILEGAFGIARGEEKRKAVIKFYEPSSYYVRNQIWHPEQSIEIMEEKGEMILLFTLPYSKSEELIGKTLKYGATAEIISPAPLRKQWLREIKKMNERFLK